jgi:hypothetical protein
MACGESPTSANDSTTDDSKNTTAKTDTFYCMVDGEHRAFDSEVEMIYTSGGYMVEGEDDTSSLGISFTDTLKAGTFTTSSEIDVSYENDAYTVMLNNQQPNSRATVTVTEYVPDGKIAGTFSGVLYNYGDTDSMVISDGNFYIDLSYEF